MDRADMLFGKHLLKHTQRREMAAGHLTNSHGYVSQVNQPLHFRPWLGKKGKAAHCIQVGHELAHAGSSIARRAPLAGRVHYLHLPHKRHILRTLSVLIAEMTGYRMHHILEHLWLQALFLKESLIQRDPLLQSREMWDHLYRCSFCRGCHMKYPPMLACIKQLWYVRRGSHRTCFSYSIPENYRAMRKVPEGLTPFRQVSPASRLP